jgi:hypothetical protein
MFTQNNHIVFFPDGYDSEKNTHGEIIAMGELVFLLLFVVFFSIEWRLMFCSSF